MSFYKITPVDTLFFRDGKPFSMEEDTVATGLFPPPPGVLYGVLRSAYATGQAISYEELVKQTGHLQITDLRYGFGQDQYYPAPLDLVLSAEVDLGTDKNPEAGILNRRDSETTMLSNNPYAQLLEAEGHVQSVNGLYMNISEWNNYLRGQSTVYTLYNPDCEEAKHFFREAKVGIGRNKYTRITEEKKLYRIAMHRMIDFGIFLDTNVKQEEKIMACNRCGAEGKIARLDPGAKGMVEGIEKGDSKYFKIVLTSPAFFSKGFEPDFSRHPLFQKYDLEILAACVGRKIAIGGFDMNKRQPKPLRYAVPAGSVYHCRIKDREAFLGDLLADQKTTGTVSISEVRDREGFGLFYLANVHPTNDN